MKNFVDQLTELSAQITGRDFESTNYSPVKEFLQLHASYIAGPLDAPSNSTFTAEARQYEEIGSYSVAYGILEVVYPHFGSGLATISGHGVMQVRFAGGESGIDSVTDSTPVAGTACFFVIEPGTAIATFLREAPSIELDASSAFCDYIVQGSCVGAHVSPQYVNYIGALTDSGGALPFRGDKPYDAIGGDNSCINAAGVGYHVDHEMAFLRTSEICGVFAFRELGLLRLSGESLEIEGESFLRQSGDFNNELSDVEQRFIYPWEVAGLLSVYDRSEIVDNGPEALFDGLYARYEPKDQNTSPIARMDVLGGYLGQGWQETVSVPREDGSPRGVFRQQVLMDGSYSVETAAGMLFVKTHDVPVIRRVEHPSVLLDGESYKFSGVIPDGEDPQDHIVRSLISDSISIEDYYAYVSRWQSTLAAHHHPHVDVLLGGTVDDTTTREWDVDGQTSFADDTAKVDDRYGEMTIKQLLSMFGVMPNGDIVFKNSQGAELRFSGGRIYMGGEGLFIDCARNVAILGEHVAVRGHSDAELVASNGNVRVKAEKNLLMLGGNGGSGGVLVESRGNSLESDWSRDPSAAVMSGVVIKSAKSHVSVYGGQILCKTGGSGNGLTSGNIVLDSSSSRVMLTGADLQRHTTGVIKDYFKNSAGQIINVNTYSPSETVVSGDLKVPGSAIIGREVQAVDSLRSARGHVYTGQAPQFQFLVEKEDNAAQIESNVEIMQVSKADLIETETIVFARLNREYAGRNRPLNPDTVSRTTFGFSPSEGYNAYGSTFRRSEWQGVYSGSSWSEPVVRYQGRRDTRPFPGNEVWTAPDALLIPSESVLIDPKTGQPKVVSSDAASRKPYEDYAATEPTYGSFISDFKRE